MPVSYTHLNILDFVNLIFDSISFWLIWQRKRLARHFIIGFSLFNIFIGTAFNIATGHFSLVGQLFSCTPDLIPVSYTHLIEEEQVSGGIMHALEKKGVPYVLAGSIRDDGPLPCVLGNAYDAQDAMRSHLRKATTVCLLYTSRCV